MTTLIELRLLEDAKETAWDLRMEHPRIADLLERLHARIVAMEEAERIVAAQKGAREEANDIIGEAEDEAERMVEEAEFDADDILREARAEAAEIAESLEPVGWLLARKRGGPSFRADIERPKLWGGRGQRVYRRRDEVAS